MQLAVAANAYDDGDLDPWRERRDRVRELLGEIISVAPSPVASDAVVMRSAAPATPLVGVERRAAATAGEKGERGENPSTIAGALPDNARRVLKFLASEGAISRPGWGLTAIADDCGLTNGQVRRATDHLRKRRLYDSADGQSGGIWLTPLGSQVAKILAERHRGK